MTTPDAITSMARNISPKVVAAAAGAGASGVVSTLILWVIGCTAYGVPATAAHVNGAVAAVPTPISAALFVALAVIGAAVPGYTATDPVRAAAVQQAGQDPAPGLPSSALSDAPTPDYNVLSGEPADDPDTADPMADGSLPPFDTTAEQPPPRHQVGDNTTDNNTTSSIPDTNAQ